MFLWMSHESLLSVSEHKYFLSVGKIAISLNAQVGQSHLLQTQGNV